MGTFVVDKPRITMVMPVYNGEKYIRQAIDSLLCQTYDNFQLLVIDDGSTDKSMEMVQSFVDPRIRVVSHSKNMGLVYTRNHGIEESRTEFVGLLDCDDVAEPNRLERQINFLDANPNVILVGGGATLIDSAGKKTGVSWRDFSPPENLPIELLFHNCFTQSAIVFRKSKIPDNPYRSGFAPAEDYDLWVRLAHIGPVANLSEILVKYRVHEYNTSSIKSLEQEQAKRRIVMGQLERLGVYPNEEEYFIHKTNFTFQGGNVAEFLKKREAWLLKLLDVNNNTRIFEPTLFAGVLSTRFFDSCRTNTKAGYVAWTLFWQSPLHVYLPYLEWRTILRIFKFALSTLSKV